jgi:hypothetical protein
MIVAVAVGRDQLVVVMSLLMLVLQIEANKTIGEIKINRVRPLLLASIYQ